MNKVVILIFSIFILQGCLLQRLEESRRQLCSGQIELSIKSALSLIFKSPTLYPDDIKKVLGENPSKIYDRGDRRYFEYIVAPKGDVTGKFDIPIEFEFIEKDGRHYLSKATAHKSIRGILPDSLLMNLFQSACYAERKGYKVLIRFDEVPINSLPDIENIKTLLGEPYSIQGDTYSYLYDLNSSDTATINIFFDVENGKLNAVSLKTFRYWLNVDFQKNAAIGQLKDFRTFLKLNFIIVFSR